MTTAISRGGTQFRRIVAMASSLALALLALPLRADEPYARSRDYDLQHSRIALRFDIDQKTVFGDVTHTVLILREGTSQIAFDSADLSIESVTVNKSPVKFSTASAKLDVPLPGPAHIGQKFEIEIRYEGKPTKGLYFILPDKNYPDQPKEIWTQGESEDTRYYLPTYDYPNDRLTTETILTVPASWITVANGKLVNVSDAGNHLKTWTWRESLPSSTYLITVVAGEFEEVKQSWRGVPVDYYAPKGRGNRLAVNYGRTPEMMNLFSKKLGVDYPWEKYAQSMVDDFVAGGMENSSATTNTSSSLRDPRLVPEFPGDEDPLISHELAHQWFGDLVTCADWGDIWLNEGFATFFETVWTESHYPKDDADYLRWNGAREWFQRTSLYSKPIVRHDFDDSSEFDENSYDKGGWVLYMLRHQIGEANFYRGLKHYLEVNRGKNVVTADLIKAINEANHIDVQQFFDQWIFGAGAPKFDVRYNYDDAKHQIALTVKQTQTLEGRVGLFTVPIEIEVTTPSGPKLQTITVSKDAETFTLPADAPPLMVLFDKGDHVLKSADFHKEKKEWLYQLKHATEVADRADAIAALGKMKNDDEAVAALGNALDTDHSWGARDQAAQALGYVGGTNAAKRLLDGLHTNDQPFVRNYIASALGNFKDDPKVVAKLETIASSDQSYRARANALQSLGRLKAADALATLQAAVKSDSPDGIVRDAALRSLGYLGDDKAVEMVREWSSPGKPVSSREAAIASLARLDKENKEITKQIASYLSEPRFPIRFAAILALGARGDASAVPALQALLKSNDLSIEMAPTIKKQIARLQKAKGEKTEHASSSDDEENEGGDDEPAVLSRLNQLEQLVRQMNERLKAIEERLSAKK